MTMRAFAPEPWVRSWGWDPWSWNVEADRDEGDASDGSGLPGSDLVAAAMAAWREVTPGADAAMAATVFALPLELASEALAKVDVAPAELDEAVQTWSMLIGGWAPVSLAACVFRVPPSAVMEAVAGHPWMFVETRGGVDGIGHEGE